MAARDRRFEILARLRIAPADHAFVGVVAGQRDLHDDARARMNRQERRIARRPLLAKARQHDLLNSLEATQHVEQGGVEASRLIIIRRGGEFVVEAETVEKPPQLGIVVGGEALVLAERIRHFRQRLAQVSLHHLAIGDVVRYLAQAVHVVGKGDQPGLDRVLGQYAERMAHHRRARDFAERAQMRQPRGAVAGLEQHFALPGALDARN